MRLCQPARAFYAAVAGLDNRERLALALGILYLALLIGQLP